MSDTVILLEDFQKAIGSYPSGGGTGTITVDTTIKKNGSQTIRLSPSAGANINAQFAIPYDLLAGDDLCLFLYCNNINSTNSISVYVSNSSFAKFFTKGINAGGLKVGWNHVCIKKSEFTTSNGAVWGACDKLQIRATAGAGQTFFVCLDSVYWRASERPRLVIGFDDGFAAVYNTVYPYMSSKNITGTVYALSGPAPGTYMSVAQLQTLYADGWDICNHTNLHEDLATLSLSAAKTTLETCRDWLVAGGFSRSYRHLAYPVNLPNATAIQAAQETGMLTARTIFGDRSYIHQRKDFLEIPGRGVAQGTALATITGDIDQLLLRGGTYMFYAHDIADTEVNANQWATSKMTGFIDYVVAKRDAGLLDILTISEWYDIAIAKQQYGGYVPFDSTMPTLALASTCPGSLLEVQEWTRSDVTKEEMP